MPDKNTTAQILTEALPYIQKYSGKIVVVKYGGNAMQSEELKNGVMKDIVLLSLVGVKVVLVHGGGPDINDLLAKLGKKAKFINGLRHTDRETMDIVAMVLAGKVNKELVSLIHSSKGKAMGLCGVDGGMIKADKLSSEEDLGYVGYIKSIDPSPIEVALENGFIPVVATIGVGDEGQFYNVNADTAAAAIASTMKAKKLVSMTDVRGVLRDKEDEESRINKIKISEVETLIADGTITAGMIPKIEGCVHAMNNGLEEAVIIDGRIKHSILLELFSEDGIGTLFLKQ